MRTALLWIVSDFPAYGMLSGWSTHGKLGCPICMGKSKAFQLKAGSKVCYFDCHRQFLPKDHLYRRQKMHLRRIHYRRRDIYAYFTIGIPFGAKYQNERIPGFGSSHSWTKRSTFWEYSIGS